MAFGKHIYTTWADLEKTVWTVEIWEDGYGGSAATYTSGIAPVIFRMGPDSDLYQTIKSVEATVNIVRLPGDDLSWLITSDNRKIKTIIKKAGTTWYTGYMISGQYYDELNYVTVLQVTFNDQISLLDSKLFEPDGTGVPYSGRRNILRQVLDALYYTGLSLPINVASNLFENTMNHADTDDAMVQASVDCGLWLDGNFEAGNCKTVITELLKSIHCRIVQANGEWWICRIRDLQNASIDYRHFSAAGSYVSNGHLTPQIETGQMTAPRFFMIKKALRYLPEWKYRELKKDVGVRNPIINDLTLDSAWLDSSTHKRWTNNGTIWHWESGGYVHADTANRTTLDVDLALISPDVAVTSSEKYSLSMRTGRGKSPVWPDTCQIEVVLKVADVDTYAYDEDNKEWVAYVPGAPTELKSITFQKVANTWDEFPLQQVDIINPPVDGEISIRIYAPYNNPLHLLDRPNHFYIGDCQLLRVDADSTDDLTDGFIYSQSINLNASEIPEPYEIRVSDCGLYPEYLGGISINTSGSEVASTVWHEKGSTDEGTLEDWIYTSWYEQHKTAQMSLEATLYGHADFHSVIKVTELGGALFLWNDVEYDVKRCQWSGNLIELKAADSGRDPAELKSRTLKDGSTQNIAQGGPLNVVPGGDEGQIQFKKGGDFDGTTDITFDGTRLLKGGTLPLIEYHAGDATVAAGEQAITFAESFQTGDDYTIQTIWITDPDGSVYTISPYDLTKDGFKVNTPNGGTFSYFAIVKR